MRTKLAEGVRRIDPDMCCPVMFAPVVGGELLDGECDGMRCRECCGCAEWLSRLADAIDREAAAAAERAANGMPVDADGVRCLLGDTVRHPIFGRCVVVAATWKGKVAIRPAERAESGNGAKYVMASEVSHAKPSDSMERIEADVLKAVFAYWGCVDSECPECPSMIDGRSPKEFYGVDTCGKAQKLDLLRRQRELLEGGDS